MKTITLAEYNSTPKDYRGIYSSDETRGTKLNGRRTLLTGENGETVLLIEGESLKIIETVIHSNGSKWAGEQPDSIEKLIEVLKSETIEERFFSQWTDKSENVRKNFCPISKGKFNERKKSEDYVHFFGNFENLSHVFNIETNDPEVIEKLTRAIQDNDGWKKYYQKNLINRSEPV